MIEIPVWLFAILCGASCPAAIFILFLIFTLIWSGVEWIYDRVRKVS